MEIRVLGPIEVIKDGESLDLGSRKQRTVLAVLAANAGNPVSVDQCLQAVWGEDAPPGAVRSLHTYVSNLRSIIDPERTGIIESTDGSYRLNLPAGSRVDWMEFEQLIGSPDADDLDKAISLWRGRPFADVEDEWARSIRTSWEQGRLAGLEAWADVRLDAGELPKLIPRLEQVIEDHPLHEPLWAKLMIAFYRAGRQADALSAYKTLSDRLAEELGIDPSPELKTLEERILQQDPTLTPPAVTPTNLPSPVEETIGRIEEKKAVETLLANTRLLTITGAGGVGKTTVAKDVARVHLSDFPDGVWWFELAPLSESRLLVSEMLGAMRMPPPPTLNAVDFLCEQLSSASSLLIFDNCEHLIEDVTPVVNSILGAAGEVKVLATSREPLGVSGEVAWTLPPLTQPQPGVVTRSEILETDAGALFDIRASQANPAFEVDDENAARIASICRRLDGLPFAIELAAARLRSMGLSELYGRLDDRFKLLTGGGREEVPHHQTLRGTVEWSYELLDPDEQMLYADLSVFRGGFELEAAEAVSGFENVVDLLDSLVAHSLVVVETQGDRVRYTMLETIREHGRELLEGTDRDDHIRMAHLSWLGNLVRSGSRELEGKNGPAWMATFRRETDNVRAALSYAAENDPVTGASICAGLCRYWYATERDVTTLQDSTSFLEEGRRWSELMLESESELPDKIRARLLTGLGGLLMVRLGLFEEAISHIKEARELWEEIGNVRNLGWAHFYEGVASWSQVPIAETIDLFDQATVLHGESEDPFGSFTSRMMRGLAYTEAGDLDKAKADLETYAEWAKKVGAPIVTAHADDALSVWSMVAGEPTEDDQGRILSAIEGFRSIPNDACLCHTIHAAAMYLASRDRIEEAARCLGVVEAIRSRLGMVLPPYEDRTSWVEDLGLQALPDEARAEQERIGRSLDPETGIEWVKQAIHAE